MKKSLIIAIILFLGVTNVYAYESDNYTIDIPNNYVTVNKDSFKLDNSDKIVTVDVITKKNSDKININEITKDSIKDNKFISSIKSEFEKINEKYKINNYSVDIININKNKAIKFELILNLTDEYSSIVYQNQYIFSSKNYIYYLTISSSDNKELSSSDVMNMVNSFTLKDKQFNDKGKLKVYYIFVGSLALIWIVGILIFKKRK